MSSYGMHKRVSRFSLCPEGHARYTSWRVRHLSAGSTSRVACKASPRSSCACEAAPVVPRFIAGISYVFVDRPTSSRLSRQPLSWIL